MPDEELAEFLIAFNNTFGEEYEGEASCMEEGEQAADFINCIAFGKNGEFAEKYLHQGTKINKTDRTKIEQVNNAINY